MRIRTLSLVALTIAALSLSATRVAHAQECFIGEVRWFAGNFAPRGWAQCNGALLPIAQNQALFSILGTTYGGDGQTTFALPDLRGRALLGVGQGPGLSNRQLGEQGGQQSVTLSQSEMPAHSHLIGATSDRATVTSPTGNSLAASGSYRGGAGNTTLNPSTASIAGGSQPHENMPPFTTLTPIICLQGIFPSRN